AARGAAIRDEGRTAVARAARVPALAAAVADDPDRIALDFRSDLRRRDVDRVRARALAREARRIGNLPDRDGERQPADLEGKIEHARRAAPRAQAVTARGHASRRDPPPRPDEVAARVVDLEERRLIRFRRLHLELDLGSGNRLEVDFGQRIAARVDDLRRRRRLAVAVAHGVAAAAETLELEAALEVEPPEVVGARRQPGSPAIEV